MTYHSLTEKQLGGWHISFYLYRIFVVYVQFEWLDEETPCDTHQSLLMKLHSIHVPLNGLAHTFIDFFPTLINTACCCPVCCVQRSGIYYIHKLREWSLLSPDLYADYEWVLALVVSLFKEPSDESSVRSLCIMWGMEILFTWLWITFQWLRVI